jgi:hypothetical protein
LSKKHYINKQELYQEVVLCKQTNQLSTKLANYFILISHGVAKKRFYKDEQIKQDAISNSIFRLCKHWRSFDQTKYTDAFPYYTEISKRALAETWNFYNPTEIEFIRFEDLLNQQ